VQLFDTGQIARLTGNMSGAKVGDIKHLRTVRDDVEAAYF
jgi:hypothetical protein